MRLRHLLSPDTPDAWSCRPRGLSPVFWRRCGERGVGGRRWSWPPPGRCQRTPSPPESQRPSVNGAAPVLLTATPSPHASVGEDREIRAFFCLFYTFLSDFFFPTWCILCHFFHFYAFCPLLFLYFVSVLCIFFVRQNFVYCVFGCLLLLF